MPHFITGMTGQPRNLKNQKLRVDTESGPIWSQQMTSVNMGHWLTWTRSHISPKMEPDQSVVLTSDSEHHNQCTVEIKQN